MRAFHFIATKYALQALRTQRMKVSRFHDLNDPFELYAADLSDPVHRKKFYAFKSWASSKFGLLCFSRGWHNPLLWSHYADRHRGVALEFEIDEDLVCPISYETNRLYMDIRKKLASGGFSGEDDEEDAYRLATTKSAHWKYEEEIRIMCPLTECQPHDGLLFEPMNDKMKITAIICGPLCELSRKEVEHALPTGIACA